MNTTSIRMKIMLLRDVENHLGVYDKPLPCFGCGIGIRWHSLLLGFLCLLLWYYATVLYFGQYYHNDPRERVGLSANAVAALMFTVAVANGDYSCHYRLLKLVAEVLLLMPSVIKRVYKADYRNIY